jgi:hypothetical protein
VSIRSVKERALVIYRSTWDRRQLELRWLTALVGLKAFHIIPHYLFLELKISRRSTNEVLLQQRLVPSLRSIPDHFLLCALQTAPNLKLAINCSTIVASPLPSCQFFRLCQWVFNYDSSRPSGFQTSGSIMYLHTENHRGQCWFPGSAGEVVQYSNQSCSDAIALTGLNQQ